LKNDIQYNGQKFEDTKGVNGSHKSKKGGQYNGQKDKMTMIDKSLSRKLKNDQHKPHTSGTSRFTLVKSLVSAC